ncbi:expressed unknown protein [Seminavis robusta]|uniref:Uncharacterized protein n=1 Tax=Seminavis robusta TaxID=568900 RepID=A0A9N8HX58_9STRA|nr:expressed unknown protein [Seminavis robusta]|eukprot:Sro2365_g325040.1 n/a (151) ;mRNA; f:8586-9038
MSGVKRQREEEEDDESFPCPSCGEQVDDSAGGSCGACGILYCDECLLAQCDVCKEKICEKCLAYPGCKACEDEITLCTECVEDHVQTCSRKSRARRSVTTEATAIQQYQDQIQQLTSSIASQQAQLKEAEENLRLAKKRKTDAESLLKKA